MEDDQNYSKWKTTKKIQNGRWPKKSKLKTTEINSKWKTKKNKTTKKFKMKEDQNQFKMEGDQKKQNEKIKQINIS